VFLLWKLILELLQAAGLCPGIVKRRKLLLSLAFLHALFFSLTTAGVLGSCEFPHYVMWGASNITPPLTCVWICIIAISYTYYEHLTVAAGQKVKAYEPRGSARLFPVHPLLLGVLSGSGYWIGNTGILLGRDVYLTLWTRQLLSFLLRTPLSPNAWEEMALFHLGTLVGNEMLFRCWEWVVCAETQESEKGKLPKEWLKKLLVARKAK
jgi:hypothetical protein